MKRDVSVVQSDLECNNFEGGYQDLVLRNVLIATAFDAYNEGTLRIACFIVGLIPGKA